LDFAIEHVEGVTERARQTIVLGKQSRPIGSKDAQIELCVEKRDLQTVGGRRVSVSVGNAMNQAFESQAPRIGLARRLLVNLTMPRVELMVSLNPPSRNQIVKLLESMRKASGIGGVSRVTASRSFRSSEPFSLPRPSGTRDCERVWGRERLSAYRGRIAVRSRAVAPRGMCGWLPRLRYSPGVVSRTAPSPMTAHCASEA
jgi:hypothetical protein